MSYLIQSSCLHINLKITATRPLDRLFLDATTVNNPAMSYGALGIAGLGFNRLSSLDNEINKTNSDTGRSLLYTLFAANQSTPNFIAFALQRSTQPDDDVEGTFSIGAFSERSFFLISPSEHTVILGEVEPEYSQVIGSNMIPTWPISNPYRWNVLVDAIIVNDSIVVPTTALAGAPSNKAVALIDSGSSYRCVQLLIVTILTV